LINCPVCKATYSYGRFICHSCEDNSICFGKVFEDEQKIYKWNCNTTIISMELMKRELRSMESIIEKSTKSHLKINKYYEWNCDYTKKFNNIHIPGRNCSLFHIYE